MPRKENPAYGPSLVETLGIVAGTTLGVYVYRLLNNPLSGKDGTVGGWGWGDGDGNGNGSGDGNGAGANEGEAGGTSQNDNPDSTKGGVIVVPYDDKLPTPTADLVEVLSNVALRSSPSSGSSQIGSLEQGRTVTVYERKTGGSYRDSDGQSDDRWLRVFDEKTGKTGWIAYGWTIPIVRTPPMVTTVSRLTIRSDKSAGSRAIGTLEKNTTIVYGREETGASYTDPTGRAGNKWLHVRDPASKSYGWIARGFTVITVNVGTS